MDTMSVRMNELPGNLRRGDLVEDEIPGYGVRVYVLTEPPAYDLIVFNAQVVPIVYLVGLDNYAGKPVKIAKAAHIAVQASRELPLNGRARPVFYRPPEPVYAVR